MKRVVKKNKSKKIREQALSQLKKTRAKIETESPEALEKLKLILEKSESEKLSHNTQGEMILDEDGVVKIDKEKNLSKILKFIQMNPHNDKLKQALRELL